MNPRVDRTLAGFVAERKRVAKEKKEIRQFQFFISAIAVVALVIAAVSMRHNTKTAPRVVFIEGARAGIPDDVRGNDKRWGLWISSAQLASSKWGDVLGHPVPAIKLIADVTACGPDAIACADRIHQIIYVSQDGADVDRTSIMMHEVAHLLGVPHIEGDALMDAKYQGPLNEPTTQAISLAKDAATLVKWSGVTLK